VLGVPRRPPRDAAPPVPDVPPPQGRVVEFLTSGVEFSIEPGESASFEAIFDGGDVATWSRLLDRPLPTPPFTWIRIEVVRGIDDGLPEAHVYARWTSAPSSLPG
jgi:hypothetical protein